MYYTLTQCHYHVHQSIFVAKARFSAVYAEERFTGSVLHAQAQNVIVCRAGVTLGPTPPLRDCHKTELPAR